MTAPSFKEDYRSQLRELKLLMNMGWRV